MTWEQMLVQMILVTVPRWPPCPYMVKKHLKIFSSRTRNLMTLGHRYVALELWDLSSLFK